MLEDKDRIFTNLYGLGDLSLKGARARGQWDNTKALIDKGRDWVVSEMKASGLRGRGGAGFPTGLKWSFMPKTIDPQRPHYLVVNADESEPGTCKDREIMRNDPHTLVEGCVHRLVRDGRATRPTSMCAASMSSSASACRRRSTRPMRPRLIGKDNIHGWPFDIYVHHGAGAYICGEETAMLESLEGKKGMPRMKPPFPAECGPLRLPDDGQQRRVDRGRADHPAPRRGVVFELRGAEQCRHQAVLRFRPRQQAVQRRRGDVDSVPRADRETLRRRARRFRQSARRHSRRLVGSPGAGRADHRYADGFRFARASCARGWAPPPSSSWTSRPTSSARSPVSPTSTCTRAAANARRAARAPAGCGA